MCIRDRKGDYLERFMENLEYGTLDSMQEVNAGILDGRYSLGVTMEAVSYTHLEKESFLPGRSSCSLMKRKVCREKLSYPPSWVISLNMRLNWITDRPYSLTSTPRMSASCARTDSGSRSTSVSYTHLDVYKRQHPGSMLFYSWSTATSRR